jgi:hypothetical protein
MIRRLNSPVPRTKNEEGSGTEAVTAGGASRKPSKLKGVPAGTENEKLAGSRKFTVVSTPGTAGVYGACRKALMITSPLDPVFTTLVSEA